MTDVRTSPSGPKVTVDGTVNQVASLEDLPAPTGGEIILPSGSAWNFTRSVDIAPYNLAPETNVTILGIPNIGGIVTNTASPAINHDPGGVPGGGIIVRDLRVENASGPGLQVKDSLSSSVLQTVVFSGCDGNAVIVDNAIAFTTAGVVVSNCAQGFKLQGAANGFIRLDNVNVVSPPAGFRGVEIVSRLQATEVLVHLMSMTLEPGTVAFDFDSVITVNRGLVTNCQFFANGGSPIATGAGKTDTTSARWAFVANQGIRASRATGEARFQNASPVTVPVSGINEWSDTTALPFSGEVLERFELNGNVLTYVGLDPIDVTLMGQMSAEHAGAGNDTFDIVVAHKAPGGSFEPAVGSTTDDIHQSGGDLNASEVRQLTTQFEYPNTVTGTQFKLLIRNKTAVAGAQATNAAVLIFS